MSDASAKAATRGYPSIGKFVGAAAAVVAVLAAWRSYDRRALPASIDAVLPLGGKQVAIVRRDERGWDHGDHYNDSYLEVADADQGRLWQHVIPHASIDSMLSPFLHNVVLAGDPANGAIVARGRVRSGTHDQTKIFAYNPTNGQPLWDATPFPATNAFQPNFHASLLVPRADIVLVFANETDKKAVFGNVVRIVALDAKTGAERWRAQEDDSLTSAFRVRGDSLVVTDLTKLRVIDLTSGQDRATFPYSDKACLTAVDAWFVDAGGLEQVRFDDLQLRTHPKPSLDGFALLGACGTRSGKLWMLAADQSRYESGAKRRWLLGLDPQTGLETGRASLGTFEIVPGVNDDSVATDFAPFARELDRFVPLIVSGDTKIDAAGATQTTGASLLMIDLDQAKVAWRSATTDAMAQDFDALWRATNVDLYANIHSDTGSITSFDPTTGQMTASLGRPSRGGWTVAFGQLWVDDEWRVAAFDAKTMAKAWSTGDVQTSDFTAQMKTLLTPVPAGSAAP